MFRAGLMFLLLGGLSWSQTPFRLSLSEPVRNLDPHRLRTSSGQYLSQQLYRHFYRLDEKNRFVPELGDHCQKKKRKWICTLKRTSKWSDGRPLTAEDFVLSYRRILTLPSPRADLLSGIQNATEILDGKKTPDQLGARALNAHQLEITWAKPELAHETVLMSPLLVPLPQGEFRALVQSGPYRLAEQDLNRVLLQPNPFYFRKKDRPPVEWVLLEENLALEAYRRGELDFVRRVATAMIPSLDADPGFRRVSFFRLDALLFSQSLEKKPELRRALVSSLDYKALQDLFHSPHRPGCWGVPLEFYEGPELCLNSDPGQVAKVPRPEKLTFVYSSLGGDDHRRLAEWLQSQWKEKLELTLKVQGLENKVYLERLKTQPPDIFRRGLSPENPSCWGALASFTTGHPDNLTAFSNPTFDRWVNGLAAQPPAQQKKTCRRALELLLKSNLVIPTGRFGYAQLLRPGWQNVRVNVLNHLDLSELSKKPTESKTFSK